MSPEDKNDFTEAITLAFKNAPSRKSNFLPTSLSGWAALFLSVGALLGGVSWAVVKINTLSDLADLEIMPQADRRLLAMELKLSNMGGLDLELSAQMRRIELLESNSVIFQSHLIKEGIHQTPDQKELATIKNLQPIRDDIGELKRQIEGVKEVVDRLVGD